MFFLRRVLWENLGGFRYWKEALVADPLERLSHDWLGYTNCVARLVYLIRSVITNKSGYESVNGCVHYCGSVKRAQAKTYFV